MLIFVQRASVEIGFGTGDFAYLPTGRLGGKPQGLLNELNVKCGGFVLVN